jgi:hypothetical protein
MAGHRQPETATNICSNVRQKIGESGEEGDDYSASFTQPQLPESVEELRYQNRGVHILTSGTANPHLRGMDPRSIRSEDQSYSDEGFSSCTEYACPALYICTPDS